jgi:cold shock CspA family protein
MSMTTEQRRLGVVRRWYDDRGFGFLRTLIRKEDGTTRIDLNEPDTFVHVSQLKKSGLQSLAERDVVFFDTHVSPRTGKVEAANIWPAENGTA